VDEFDAADLEIDSLQSLSQAEVGCDFQIKFVIGPRCQQLRELGLCETVKIRKLQDGSVLVCEVCGSRIALSAKLAKDIKGTSTKNTNKL
jgi:ferrous iron transport protein A